jgi:hypothetical protein
MERILREITPDAGEYGPLYAAPPAPPATEGTVGHRRFAIPHNVEEPSAEEQEKRREGVLNGPAAPATVTTVSASAGGAPAPAPDIMFRSHAHMVADGVASVDGFVATWGPRVAPASPETGPMKETPFQRQWRESAMWDRQLEGYPHISDDQRRADPRYNAIERWVYRVLSLGNCPGSYPISAAIAHDLDALNALPHDSEDPRDTIERILREYRCQHTLDDDGEPLPLIDALSPGETVAEGRDEVHLIADDIAYQLYGPDSEDPPSAPAPAIRSKYVLPHESHRWVNRIGTGFSSVCADCGVDNEYQEALEPCAAPAGDDDPPPDRVLEWIPDAWVPAIDEIIDAACRLSKRDGIAQATVFSILARLRRSAAGDDEVATDSGGTGSAAAPLPGQGAEPSATAAESSLPFVWERSLDSLVDWEPIEARWYCPACNAMLRVDGSCPRCSDAAISDAAPPEPMGHVVLEATPWLNEAAAVYGAYSDEADEDDGWAMIKAWSREEADGHRESMIQCHRDVGATATFNEEPGETERFAATVHVCALVPVGATPSAPAPRTDPTSSQTEAGMSSPAHDASQPSAIGGGSARASSVAAPAPEVEQAYVDSLHRQLDTKRAQMAHDRLKIDGLEKRVRALRQALTLCAEWFDGYAASHRAKGADEKAARNEERAGFCYRALASTPETTRGEADAL